MADTMEDVIPDTQEIEQETPPENVFIPPSVDVPQILSGASYSHYSPLPQVLTSSPSTECVLGIDEAGRGPVLGPMVYACLYLPTSQHHSLLQQTHHFTDSKALTPTVRSGLMAALCTPGTDLHAACGWATTALSARAIGAGMLRAQGAYNLNAQAMDATVALVQGVLDRGINVREVYVDTVGRPETYQRRLEALFPMLKITVEKKADAIYPCVSAASVCAKVTRDAALEVCYTDYAGGEASGVAEGWGSGYPSDARCVGWLKRSMDPLFGWGSECRFSWGTVKEMLEERGAEVKVEWPVDDDDNGMKMTDFFAGATEEAEREGDELANWYGRRVTEEVF